MRNKEKCTCDQYTVGNIYFFSDSLLFAVEIIHQVIDDEL